MHFLSEVKKLAFSVDIMEDAAQVPLTQQWILPFIQPFLSDLKIMRKLFDKAFLDGKKKEAPSSPMYGVKSIDIYPAGYCFDIRNGLYEMLKKHPLVMRAQQKGLVFKKVYVSLNDSYFQNGIQLGSIWIDVANDTVNPDEPSIYYKPLAKLNYQNLEDYQHYCAVAEKYLNLKLYPNTLFPNIALCYPMFSIDENGVCDIFNHQEIILYKDILAEFRLAEAFIQQNSVSNPLPLAYQTLIQNNTMLKKYYSENIPDLKKTLLAANDGQLAPIFRNFHEEKLAMSLHHEVAHFIQLFALSQIKPTNETLILCREQGVIPEIRNL